MRQGIVLRICQFWRRALHECQFTFLASPCSQVQVAQVACEQQSVYLAPQTVVLDIIRLRLRSIVVRGVVYDL
jgi:hypothetical protein